MFRLFESFLNDVLSAFLEWLADFVVGMLDTIFWPESTMQVGGWGPLMNFDPVFAMFRNIGLAFITLKFLKKGFDIYVGWVDGDKDNDASHLVLNYGRAIVMVLAFSEVYRFITNVVSTLLTDVLLAVGLEQEALSLLQMEMATGIINVILALILLIMLVILHFRMLLMGLQLLALRIAFPVACVGLVDSDKGLFKGFMQKFVMISVSAFSMLFFFYFAVLLMINLNPIWAIAAAMAAMRTPDLLRDFMLGYGTNAGGGLNRMLHTSTMLARSGRQALRAIRVPVK